MKIDDMGYKFGKGFLINHYKTNICPSCHKHYPVFRLPLMNRCFDCDIDLIEFSEKEDGDGIDKRQSKLQRFRAAGLIGCLNDSAVTSQTYKILLYELKERLPIEDKEKL